MIKNYNNGSFLIATTILYLLISISVGFVLLNVAEINEARRYYHSTSAFWLAEAGINMYVKNPSILNNSTFKTFSYGDGTINLIQDDSTPMFRYIIATGIFGGIQKKIQIAYAAHAPEAYRNAVSSKGNITITGDKSSFIINDKTRVSGQLINHSKFGPTLFEDVQYNQDSSLTSLNYPNTDQSGTNDEFQNFIQNNNDLINTYPQDEILHIKTDGTYKLPTDGSLKGKKIIFIEGSNGGGNVLVESNEIVLKNQNLTIICTGNVTFNQSGFQAPNSQLNFIAWEGYNESVSTSSSFLAISSNLSLYCVRMSRTTSYSV